MLKNKTCFKVQNKFKNQGSVGTLIYDLTISGGSHNPKTNIPESQKLEGQNPE